MTNIPSFLMIIPELVSDCDHLMAVWAALLVCKMQIWHVGVLMFLQSRQKGVYLTVWVLY